MLDIDRFKRFNDTFGHEAGDTLLGALGNFVRAHIWAGDIACRYGGEEFTLILPDATLEATRMRAEQLREGVKKLQVPHRGRLLGPITLSLGVATFPDHGSTSESLLSAADGVLYRAKQEGRDRVVVAR
jgi:diguanylate cyclase (GGDEF)-like protein